jgi:tetratricopeptide (TPR) repeat protein
VRGKRIENLTDTLFTKQPRIGDLARNPLLLTIIALIHRTEAVLPDERVKLYERCVTTLLDTWDQIKEIQADRERVYYQNRESLLKQLAFWMHSQPGPSGQVREIQEGELEDRLVKFLRDDPTLQLNADRARQEARSFVKSIKGRAGLLTERGEGVYAFPHPTFQEYLAARHIRETSDGADEIWAQIQPCLHDPHWQEVILLLLGSLNNNTAQLNRLLETIASQTDEYELILHRHLFLAARALADRVKASVALRQQIAKRLLNVIQENELATWDAIDALSNMENEPLAEEGLVTVVCDPTMAAKVQSTAAFKLSRFGNSLSAPSINHLLHLAVNKGVEAFVRIAVLETLCHSVLVNDAVNLLLYLANDPSITKNMRISAANTLGQLGHISEAREILLAFARDNNMDEFTQSLAAEILGQLGLSDDAVPIFLAHACTDTVDAFVRRTAVQALSRFRPANETISFLLALAQAEYADADFRKIAVDELINLGRIEDATKILVAWSENEHIALSIRLTAALTGQEEHADDISIVLLALARNEFVTDKLRKQALIALSKLGRADDAVLAGLLALSNDERIRDNLRVEAVKVLGQLGRADVAVLDCLRYLAHDISLDAGVRFESAQALVELGLADDSATALFAIATDMSIEDHIRCDAAYALGKLNWADEAVSILLTFARSEQLPPYVRSTAYSSLKMLLGGVRTDY